MSTLQFPSNPIIGLALWWDIDLIAEPAPEGLLMENGDPINGEDSTPITEE